MAPIIRYPIFAALDTDWHRFARSDPAREAVKRWRQADPDLADLHTVSDVLALRRSPQRANAVLRGLVRLAPTDPTAARAVLQALIPGLVRLCDRWRVDDRDTFSGEVVAIAWDMICTYVDRERSGASVAMSLLFDVRRVVAYDMRPLALIGPCGDGRPAEEIALESVAFEELRARARDAMADNRNLELVIDTRVNGRPIVEVARACGENPHNVLMRRHRAENRLREHLVAA